MTVEKAIEILSDVGDINRCCAEDAEALDMAIKALRLQDAPTYEARPISRWLRKIDRDSKNTYFECVQCEKYGRYRYRYCPNCGAKMEVDDNAE